MSVMNRALGVSGEPNASAGRKLGKTKGFWANGVWVKAQDAAAEKAQEPNSRAQDKADSDALQALGLALLDLRAASMAKLVQAGDVGERLAQELATYKKIDAFGAKKRQGQLIGKLMRDVPDESVAAMRKAVYEQKAGSLSDAAAFHRLERWRDDLLDTDDALPKLLKALRESNPETPLDTQQVRALVRQARKDRAAQAAVPEGQAPRQSRAYRELFQLIKQHFEDHGSHPNTASE